MAWLDVAVDVGTLLGLMAVFVGLVLAGLEIRHMRLQREETLVMEVVRAGQAKEATRALHILAAHPAPIDPRSIEGNEDLLFAASTLGILYETWGYMVHRGILPLQDIEDLTGGTIRSGWDKLRDWVAWTRSSGNSPRAYEWFEWLTQQLEASRPTRPPMS